MSDGASSSSSSSMAGGNPSNHTILDVDQDNDNDNEIDNVPDTTRMLPLSAHSDGGDGHSSDREEGNNAHSYSGPASASASSSSSSPPPAAMNNDDGPPNNNNINNNEDGDEEDGRDNAVGAEAQNLLNMQNEISRPMSFLGFLR